MLSKIELNSRNENKVEQAKLLLFIPENICASATVFTKDENLMLEHRRKIADAIESLIPYLPK